MRLLIGWVGRGHRQEGYLCLDDVVIEKAFAKRLSWAGWTYSFAKKRKIYGLHVVVLLWCEGDGDFHIPVAFRLWRPKCSCAPGAYHTKLKLAEIMLKEVLGSGLKARYIVFDTHYSAGWFTKMVTRMGLVWIDRYALSEDDLLLARQAAPRGRVGREAAFEVAKTPRGARCNRAPLRSQVRFLAVGRDQKPL